MANDQDGSPSSIADSLPDAAAEGAITAFCAVCPNWIEIEYVSSIPENMPTHMEAAGLTSRDIRVQEAGMSFVITDVDQEVFTTTKTIPPVGPVRVTVPSGIEEVIFAFESTRPDQALGVPEGEQPGEDEEGWVEGLLRGVVSGGVRGINAFLDATYEFDRWAQDNLIATGGLQFDTTDGFAVRWVSAEEMKADYDRGVGTIQVPNIDRPTSTVGRATEGVAQFLVGFIPAVRVVRLTTATTAVGKTVQYATAGAIADATVFDPHEQRLANLVQQFPELRNPVTEYLASDPNDSQAEGRLKNALEGLLFGAVLEGFMRALRVMKYGATRVVAKMRTQHRYVFESETLEGVVDVLIQAATRVEATVTPALQSIAQRTNGTMAGLEYRIKGADSLSGKITRDAVDEGKIYSKVAENIKDVLRYTILYPDANYARSVRDALDQLMAQGYRKDRLKNFWNSTGDYQGINAVFETPSGYKFELQFHTPSSLAAKQAAHPVYEALREGAVDALQEQALKAQARSIFSGVRVPNNVGSIR